MCCLFEIYDPFTRSSLNRCVVMLNLHVDFFFFGKFFSCRLSPVSIHNCLCTHIFFFSLCLLFHSVTVCNLTRYIFLFSSFVHLCVRVPHFLNQNIQITVYVPNLNRQSQVLLFFFFWKGTRHREGARKRE